MKSNSWYEPAYFTMAVLCLLLWCLLYGGHAQGMAGRPPDDFACDRGTIQPNPAWTFVRCAARAGTDMVPADATWEYPSGWVVETKPTKPLTLKFKFDGWGHFPEGGVNANFSEPGAIVIKSVYSHFPLSKWTDVRGNTPLDWGGPFRGVNSNGNRFAATISAIAARGYTIDYNAGFTLGGNCYGAAAAVTQSILLPGWQPFISHIDTTLPGMTADENTGMYFRNRTAWAPFDVSLAQHENHADKLQHIFYRFRAGSFPTDEIGFSQTFLTDVCDAGHVACFATWGDQGHAWPDPKSPAAYQAVSNQLYAGPYVVWRLDRMKVVFTHSSANHYGPRGHYNLGLSYDLMRAGWVDSADSVRVPIRYRRQTDMGPGLPDQPLTAVFKVHLRPRNMALNVGDSVSYAYGGSNGVVEIATNGEISVPVSLGSSETFTMLEIWR